MTLVSQYLVILSSLAAVLAVPATQVLSPRQYAAYSSVVNFANNTGTPQHLAAGFLYGIPDAPNQIPSHFYTDMDFKYTRVGGSQLPAPARGWIWGAVEYENRFKSALSNYRTARQYGATTILLSNDLWGADTTQNSTAPYPGDNGDWSLYYQFMAAMIADIKNNGMTTGLVIDIWNEPDGPGYWTRSQDQYNELWARGTALVRKAFGSQVLVSGPSTASSPSLANSFWTSWAPFALANGSIPDQYVWHMEGGGGSMGQTFDGLQQVLHQYGLPQRVVNINEYAIASEQNPSGSAWFIAQLERINALGLRGNWLYQGQLHDFMASLLSKPGAPDVYSTTGTGYYPNGDYQVYKYYATNMTGHRIGTTPSSDEVLDTYVTVNPTARTGKILAGMRENSGTYYIQLENLSALGLPQSGSLSIHTYQFTNNGHYGQINGPTDLGSYTHNYVGNGLLFYIQPNPTDTAYTFEFSY